MAINQATFRKTDVWRFANYNWFRAQDAGWYRLQIDVAASPTCAFTVRSKQGAWLRSWISYWAVAVGAPTTAAIADGGSAIFGALGTVLYTNAANTRLEVNFYLDAEEEIAWDNQTGLEVDFVGPQPPLEVSVMI